MAPGTGYAVITFKGAYKGTIKRAFTIKENTALYKSGLDRKLRITTKSTKVSVKWGKAATADGYDVFLTKCGTDFSRKPSVTTKKQTVSVAKARGKKVSSSQCYKAYVKAYRMVKGKKQYIATSAMIHSAGSRNKYTNASGITGVPDTKVLKTGKTYQLKAKIKKADKKKPLIKKVHSPWLRYGTTDSGQNQQFRKDHRSRQRHLHDLCDRSGRRQKDRENNSQIELYLESQERFYK